MYWNSDFDGDFDDYDLIILYQCSLSSSMLTKVDKRKIPIWFIVGQNSDVTELNNIQDDVFNNLNNEFVNSMLTLIINFKNLRLMSYYK